MIDISNKTDYWNTSIQRDLVLNIDGQTIGNSSIYSESLNIQEKIMTNEQLTFGGCNSAQLKVTIRLEVNEDGSYVFGDTPLTNLIGKTLIASMVVNEVSVALGKYTIQSAKRQNNNKNLIDIVAIDLLDSANADISSWYSTLTFPMTLKTFRDGLFAHLGIVQETVNLPQDSIQIQKGYTSSEINGKSVIKAICEVNGRFGMMDRNGVFKYVKLGTTATDVTDIYRDINYEEYGTQLIDNIIVKSDSDLPYSYRTGTNPYVINSNPILHSLTTTTLATVCGNLYPEINNIFYTPCDLTMRGLPYVECGDKLKIGDIEFYVFDRTLNGIQALMDSIDCNGAEYLKTDLNSIETQLTNLNNESEILSRKIEETAEGILIEVRKEIAENVGSKNYADFDTIISGSPAGGSEHPEGETLSYTWLIGTTSSTMPSMQQPAVIRFNYTTFETITDNNAEEFSISLSFRKKSGTAKNINIYAPNLDMYDFLSKTEYTKVYFDDTEIPIYEFMYMYTGVYYAIPDDTNEHTLKFCFKYTNEGKSYLFNNIGVDFNSAEETYNIDSMFEVWNIVLNKGTEAIEWTDPSTKQSVLLDEVVSAINMSPTQIQINASKIDLNGVVTANNNFKILEDGSMECASAKITGGSINIDTDSKTTDIVKLKYTDTSGVAWESGFTPNGLWSSIGNDSKAELVCGGLSGYYKIDNNTTRYYNFGYDGVEIFNENSSGNRSYLLDFDIDSGELSTSGQGTLIGSNNIGSQSVNYANSAGTISGFTSIQNEDKGSKASYYLGFDGGGNPVQAVPWNKVEVATSNVAKQVQSDDGYIKMWVDAEGGNIELHAGNNHTNKWQLDAYDGKFRGFTNRESDGAYKYFQFDQDGNLITNANKFANRTDDVNTENTTDTWVLVCSGGGTNKIQHRVIPTAWNNAPIFVTKTVTTGTSGNIDTGYINDGKTFIVSAFVNGANYMVHPWVTSGGKWYVTVKNPNTNATINSTSVQLRLLVLKI